MIEDYYYQIDGIVYGPPRQMSSEEATARNAELEKAMLRARWSRQHEFVWIDDAKGFEAA